MARSIYAWELEATECPTCSAPVVAPLGTGRASCEQCGAEVFLPERPREAAPDAALSEEERIGSLFAQLERFDPKGPFVPWFPPELQRYEMMIAQPERRDAALAGLRRAWEEARAAMTDSPNVDASARAFRIGQGLGRIYAEVDEHACARAVLESTLHLAVAREQRDLIRCRLARHALRAGDEAAHAAWVGDCDPRPVALEVDGELRSTQALAAYKRRDWRAVIAAMGRSHREVPLAFPIAPLGLCLRAHGLAGLGEHAAAEDEIRHLSASVPMGYVRAKQTWARHPGPSSEYAIAVARKASPTPTPRSQPVVGPSPPGGNKRWWWPFGTDT